MLGNPQTYSGAGRPPFGLNAYNATGAYLTNLIPNYTFSIDAYNNASESDTCPIDHFGHYKVPQDQ